MGLMRKCTARGVCCASFKQRSVLSVQRSAVSEKRLPHPFVGWGRLILGFLRDAVLRGVLVKELANSFFK